jgi:DNA-binding CsgD family transcriptional regulator/PAS domain-containing protein
MISVEAFSELLQTLYSAPLHKEQWQRFLTRVCDYTGFTSGYFFSASTRTGFGVVAEGGTIQSRLLLGAYNEAYVRQDPFRAALIAISRHRDPTGVYSGDDLVPANKFLASQLYREIYMPLGLRYSAAVAINISLRRLEGIGIWRGEQDGALTPDSRRLLELLLPHIRTALEFRHALGEAQGRLALSELLANANPDPVFALGADGRIESTNAAGESLLRAGDGLGSAGGRLVATNGSQAGELSALLSASGRGNVLALRRNGNKRPLQLIATPLAHEDRRATHADVLLLVNDPDKPVLVPDETLRSLYSFTPAEAEIANGLLMGYTPAEISCLRRVAASTVRQQVKTMLQKTDCAHRATMVRLLMTLPQAAITRAG